MYLTIRFMTVCVAGLFFVYFSAPQLANGQDRRVVLAEDFESGINRWELLDPKTWKLKQSANSDESPNHTFAITARETEYKPPVRSPGHVALVKDLVFGNVEIKFRVRSLLDTGDHRDCCVFFGYKDDQHFYYVHVGARPDPNSGQIMIVKDAPRLALTDNKRKTPWDDNWHNVKLIRNLDDGTIKLFFDDMSEPHMEVTDKTFGEGRVGIGSFDDVNEFDDIVISTF